jgi:SAM-dependent methyltransferase
MKRLLAPIFLRLARALGVSEIQNRLTSIEGARTTAPDLYVRLEQAFRGDPVLIAARQSQYLVHIRPSVSESAPLLDLGCGRGEWLSLLKSEGLSASGIDGNHEAVALCEKQGLNVHHREITQTLRSTPKGSLGAITLFQVLEHLPFADVLTVLKQARELLTADGVLIAEIPNSETLRVGAGTFWIDPTHDRPLFPPVLRFLAEEAGFTRIQSVYSTPLEEAPNLDGVDPKIATVLLHMHQQINGNGDFAIVARN